MRNKSAYTITIPNFSYYKRNIPCQTACPIHTACGRYVQKIACFQDEEAYQYARAPNPFVYALGRVCAHPCETACRRGIIDEPIAIRALKRFVTDQHNLGLGHDPSWKGKEGYKRGKKIAIVGAGPCGLTCAHDLARLGYDVEIFESAPVPGGMLYLGIPHYRLPREIIRMEVDQILALGIELHTRTTVGRDISLKELRSTYDALFLATGLNRGKELNIKGVHLDGVINGIDFLINVNLGYKVNLGKRVVVIGGGNVAIDVARTVKRILEEPEDMVEKPSPESMEDHMLMQAFDAARLALRAGASEVMLVSLEKREEMPAWEWEVQEGEEEGIRLINGWGPLEILGQNGRVTGIRLRQCLSVFDENQRFNPIFSDMTQELSCDNVIVAIGQQADISFLRDHPDIQTTPWGTIKTDEALATTVPGIFAGGDVVFGPRILVEAIANGHTAAESIHAYLEGKPKKQQIGRFMVIKDHTMPIDYLSTPRQPVPMLPSKRRIGITEVELGYQEAEGRKEASRCLKCQINTIFNSSKCILCNGCVDICPENCYRMVDVTHLMGEEKFSKLLSTRYGISLRKLKRRQLTAIIKDEMACTRCGLCARRCPTGAITMESFEWEVRS